MNALYAHIDSLESQLNNATAIIEVVTFKAYGGSCPGVYFEEFCQRDTATCREDTRACWARKIKEGV